MSNWHVKETGCTLEENAFLKARNAVMLTGNPAIADDTGLFVTGLGGGPGIYAARFAGVGCSYEDNVKKILKVLKGEREPARKAIFRTVAAFCAPGGEEFCVTGEVRGRILLKSEGTGGFGYDPVFFVKELGKTFAQCSLEEKNTVSHRSRAFALLKKELEKGSLFF